MRTNILLLGLALLAANAVAYAAAVYRWVDAQGIVHYSDTPHAGASQIDLANAQTYAAPPLPPPSAPPPTPPKPVYQSCAISSPTQDQVFFAEQSVHVSVRVDPGLRPGDRVDLTMDGAPVPAPSANATEFEITPVYRGTHTLAATVFSAGARPVCTVAPVTFHMRQPSMLSPQSPLRRR